MPASAGPGLRSRMRHLCCGAWQQPQEALAAPHSRGLSPLSPAHTSPLVAAVRTLLCPALLRAVGGGKSGVSTLLSASGSRLLSTSHYVTERTAWLEVRT